MSKSITLYFLLPLLAIAQPIFPPNHAAKIDWNIRIETLNERGEDLFKQLFTNFNNLNQKAEILASFSTWSEAPLYVDSLNSILFSSPADRNLYQYNLHTKTTTLFIENAGEFGGIYDQNTHGNIPLHECSECGPNGMTIGINGLENHIILNQLALNRVIAFDPTDINEDNIIIIADNYKGIQLNSPNDITITNNGKYIYFTDPTFGLQKDGDTGFTNSFSRSALGFQGVYRIDADDINNAILVVNDMEGPNGLAVTNDNKYLIIANTGSVNGWKPYWNIYKIKCNNKNEYYKLYKTIYFNMGILEWNSWKVGAPLTDGMEVYNDEILLAVCPNGICLIDLKDFTIVGRIAIDHLISNIYIHGKWIYITGADNLWRIRITA